MVAIFLHSLDFLLIACTLHNLRIIILDPYYGLLKAHERIKWYIIVSVLGSLGSTCVAFISDIYGASVFINLN